MLPALAIIFIGWPAILGSLLLSVYGIVKTRPAFLVAGAVLCLGFAWYLTAWPLMGFQVIGYSLPVTHLAGALAVQRHRAWLAWPLLLPHAGIASYLAAVVVSQG
ncbi:MAG TPA: hypothetical protein VNT75_09075 [Symbiobacteriaceae bacterium]|nr:hypothetical protein [Symbiobacteriaceae bacterium]